MTAHIFAMIPNLGTGFMECPIVFPITTGVDRPQFEDGLRPLQTPSCPGDIHTVINQVATGSLYNATGNGKTLEKSLVIA